MATKRSFYVVSLSTKRIIYKGMLSSEQLRHYYPDLLNPHLTSAIALVHSRFSTNTFPTWIWHIRSAWWRIMERLIR